MSMSRVIDFDHAAHFLAALGRGDEVFVFQTIDDNKERKDRALSKVLVGTLDQMRNALQHYQDRGAGVFVQVQAGQKRGEQSITQGRAVFIDADDVSDLDALKAHMDAQPLPEPSCRVISSAGKEHWYWWTTPYRPDQVKQALRDFADIAGTDGGVVTVDRVMRLPGTWHQKDSNNPQQVKIVEEGAASHDFDHLMRLVPQCQRRGVKQVAHGGGGVAGPMYYDPHFGMPISPADDMEWLPSGGRTQRLISHIGRQVAAGYSAQYIEDEVRRMVVEKLPPGDKPITEQSLQQEILPAIYRFQESSAPAAVRTAPPPPPSATTPATPPPPPAAGGPPPPPSSTPSGAPLPPSNLNASTPILSEPVSDRPSVALPLEVWEERYVWVQEGQYVVDTTRPLQSGVYSASDFEKAHKNNKVGKGHMFNIWLSSPRRRTVRDFMFYPGRGRLVVDHKALYLNTYEAPDLPEIPSPGEHFRVFEDHMARLFDEPASWYRMMNWFVFTLKHPGTRVPWAPLLVSRQGTGKSWLFELLREIVGDRYAAAVETHDLEIPYNAYMKGTVVVCMEEVKTRKKYETTNRLKVLITNPTLEINEKHGKKGQERIFANVFMTSNYEDALALGYDDLRRYFVYLVKSPPMDKAEAMELYSWLDTDGPQALYRWCMKTDQGQWQFNKWPEHTEGFDTMVKASMSVLKRAMVECLEDRIGVFQCDIGDERQIEQTLASCLDQDRLDKAQKQELSHTMREHVRELRRVKSGSKYLRLFVWRRDGLWSQQTDTQLIKEHARASLAAAGREVPPSMGVVQGGGAE